MADVAFEVFEHAQGGVALVAGAEQVLLHLPEEVGALVGQELLERRGAAPLVAVVVARSAAGAAAARPRLADQRLLADAVEPRGAELLDVAGLAQRGQDHGAVDGGEGERLGGPVLDLDVGDVVGAREHRRGDCLAQDALLAREVLGVGEDRVERGDHPRPHLRQAVGVGGHLEGEHQPVELVAQRELQARLGQLVLLAALPLAEVLAAALLVLEVELLDALHVEREGRLVAGHRLAERRQGG